MTTTDRFLDEELANGYLALLDQFRIFLSVVEPSVFRLRILDEFITEIEAGIAEQDQALA